MQKIMKLSKKTPIVLAVITASLIVATGSVTNAMPSWIAFGEFSCTDDPRNQANKSRWDLGIEREKARIAEEERVSVEKAKAKEREEAERVAKTELEHKATRDNMDCLMNEIIMGRGEPVREYIFPDKNHRRNACD